MTERKLKRLILFLLEVLVLQGGRVLDQDFAEQINDFIYRQYEEDPELLNIIFDIDALREFIDSKEEILSLPQIVRLIYSYPGFDNYVKLVEEIGIEEDQKINHLASLFDAYCHELLQLLYADSSIYYPKGYPRILQ